MPVSDQPACFCPCRVFPRGSRSYRKGNSCSFPSQEESSNNRVPTIQLSMRAPHIHGGLPGYPRWVPGRDAEQGEFRLVLVSVPVARERPLLVSVWIHHVLAPVVKDHVETRVPVALGLRCHPFGRPDQPREAGRAGRRVPMPVVSRQALLSQPHFRVASFASGGGPSTCHAFRRGHRVHALSGAFTLAVSGECGQ